MWEPLGDEFLPWDYPRDQKDKLRSNILSFRQHMDEILYEAWKRFKEMMWKFPNHELRKWE